MTFSAFDCLAEERIRAALARGEFDDLPGAGQPLVLDDDPLVPEDLRVAYRVLRNAGFLPPELGVHGEIRAVEQLLQQAEDGSERTHLLAKLNFLLSRAGAGRRRGSLLVEQAYFERLAEKLSRPSGRRPAPD
jgi:hypothetical protein